MQIPFFFFLLIINNPFVVDFKDCYYFYGTGDKMKFSELKRSAEANDENNCFLPTEELRYTQYAIR